MISAAAHRRARPRAPQLRLDTWSEAELFVDLFAGGGGTSEGVKAAIGRDPDIAVNHSAIAIAMHAANHPATRHFCESVYTVDPIAVCGGRPVWGLWASPDCFPAGTMVLTRAGYVPIERVEVGDEVLTHQRRWRRVTSTMRTTRPVMRIRGYGHPGIVVSAEHPFLARRREDRWNNERRNYDRHLEPQAWVAAGDLDRGWYWASPTAFPDAAPPPIPVHQRRTLAVDVALMWLAGRYVADGWTRITDTRADLVITCGHHEIEGLREQLGRWGRVGARAGAEELAWHERETTTAYQFTASHRGLVEWLREHFGHGAAEKRIPGWALGMDHARRESLLAGYLSGDGSRAGARGEIVEATTVSRALAYGVKALAASLGKTAAVYVGTNRSTIQGRVINARDAYRVRWRDSLDETHRQTFRENGIEWAPIRETEDLGRDEEVFNLSVEEDESYIVEGLIVHNCTHHSKAKGGKPRKKKIRGLAWVVCRWAKAVRPRVIFLENVAEFADWGPLDENDKPIAARKGETFRAWKRKLESYGYVVEHRTLVAADYGAPTTRKRLFLIARRDGEPIVWPEPTHAKAGKGRRRWRAAAEIIDWSLQCPSIFERKKPLAEPTMRRIAVGIWRYVIDAARPFIVPVTHPRDRRVHGYTGASGCVCDLVADVVLGSPEHPAQHLDACPLAVAAPFTAPVKSWGGGGNGPRSIEEPTRTVTASKRGEHALVVPTLIQRGFGERDGQTPRVPGLEKLLGTVVAQGVKHGLVAAFLTKHYGSPPHRMRAVGHEASAPLSTVTTQDHHALSVAFLDKMYSSARAGVDAREPMPTVTSGGGRGGGHIAAVRAFLAKYDRAGAPHSSDVELDARTAKGLAGIVTIGGEDFQIVDIGMRMLSPRELFRAQGFGDHYVIDPIVERTQRGKRIRGPLGKTGQTAMAGNSVPPQLAEQLVRANLPRRAEVVAC